MVNHPNRAKAKWLKGNGGTEFLQFAAARIVRAPFPLGGYYYTVNDSGTGKQIYGGNDYETAYIRASKAQGVS